MALKVVCFLLGCVSSAPMPCRTSQCEGSPPPQHPPQFPPPRMVVALLSPEHVPDPGCPLRWACPSPPRAAQVLPEGRSVPVGALLQAEVQLLSVLPPGHEGLGGAPGLAGQRGGVVGCQGQVGGAGGDGGRLWGESSVRRPCAGWGRPRDPTTSTPQEAGRGGGRKALWGTSTSSQSLGDGPLLTPEAGDP